MAARDRYIVKIICPQCGEEGALHISEDDYPFMKKLYRTVDKVEGNFVSRMKDEYDATILCKNCGHEFVK